MKTERRFVSVATGPVQLEKRADGESRIVGYGAVFYDGSRGTQYQLWEGYLERIMPGAFDRAISEKDDVRGLFNHDPNHVLGRSSAGTMLLSIDAKGLRYEITPGDTTIAKDVQEHLRRGDVTGSSFSFRVTDETESKVDGVWIREIRGVKLYDVGPVTFPAYEGTSASVRSDDFEGARAFFEQLKKRQAATPNLDDLRLRLEVTETPILIV